MASVTVYYPRCQSAQVYRHGQNAKGHDRFRCRDCHRVFQLTYSYEARKPGVKEQITEMAFNGAGGSRYCPNTESRYSYRHPDFKKLSPQRITSSPVAHADVALI
jgi:insertion element IS1 protein InsB